MISLWIAGQPPRKSNSRRIVTNRQTGRPMLIKSKQALNWVQAAIAQIPAGYRNLCMGSLERPLAVVFTIFYKSRRPDLSVELIQDMLQEAGIISDDRYIYEVHAFKTFDPEEPGVEIYIQYQDDISKWLSARYYDHIERGSHRQQ